MNPILTCLLAHNEKKSSILRNSTMVKRKRGRSRKNEATNNEEKPSSPRAASANKRRKRDRISPIERMEANRTEAERITGSLAANRQASQKRKSVVIEMEQLIIRDKDATVVPYSEDDYPSQPNPPSTSRERNQLSSKRRKEDDEKLIAQYMPFLIQAGWIYDEETRNYRISLESTSFAISRQTLLHNLEKSNEVRKEHLQKFNLKVNSETLAKAQIYRLEESILCGTLIERDIDAYLSTQDSYERAQGFEPKFHGRFLQENKQVFLEKTTSPNPGSRLENIIDHQDRPLGENPNSNTFSSRIHPHLMSNQRSSTKVDVINPQRRRRPSINSDSVSVSLPLPPFSEQLSPPPSNAIACSNIFEEPYIEDSRVSMEEPDIKFKFVKKVLPKYVGYTRETLLPHDFLATILKNKMLSTQDKTRIKVHLADIPNDGSSVQFLAKGRSDLVDKVTTIFFRMVSREYFSRNTRLLLSDRKSLVVDVKVDVTIEFGIDFMADTKKSTETEGVWVNKVKVGSQMHKIFASALDKGCVITRISKFGSGKSYSINKMMQIKDFVEKAKFTFERSGSTDDKWAIIQVCISNHADLGGLNRNMVVLQKNKKGLYHRDGTRYTGKWNFPFEDDMVTSLKANSYSTAIEEREESLPSSVDCDKLATSKVSKTSRTKKTQVLRASDIVRMEESKLKDQHKASTGYKLPLKRDHGVSKTSEFNVPNSQQQDSYGVKKILRRENKVREPLSFQILFKPSTGPLGFFCTDAVSSNGSKCIITSIDPNGTAKRKTDKIRRGSTIESYGTTVCKEIVRSYDEVRVKYEALKRSNGNLVLTFRNDPMNSCQNESYFDDKWTGTGAWAGGNETGWPGGAARVTKKSDREKERIERKEEAEALQRARIRDALKQHESHTDAALSVKSGL